MGHQVNFLALPTDLIQVEANIRTVDGVRFLDDRGPTREPVEIETLAFAEGEMGRRPLRACIVRSDDLGDVRTTFIQSQGYWVVDALQSPVIEFTRCFFDGDVLWRGRCYFATDQRFRAEPLAEDFIAWGDRVLDRVRKSLARMPEISTTAYVGADARGWIEAARAIGDNVGKFRRTRGS